MMRSQLYSCRNKLCKVMCYKYSVYNAPAGHFSFLRVPLSGFSSFHRVMQGFLKVILSWLLPLSLRSESRLRRTPEEI